MCFAVPGVGAGIPYTGGLQDTATHMKHLVLEMPTHSLSGSPGESQAQLLLSKIPGNISCLSLSFLTNSSRRQLNLSCDLSEKAKKSIFFPPMLKVPLCHPRTGLSCRKERDLAKSSLCTRKGPQSHEGLHPVDVAAWVKEALAR